MFMRKVITRATVLVATLLLGAAAFTTAQSISRVTGVSNFYDVIQIAVRWLVIIIGPVFVVVGGIQYMTSGGDEEGTKAAKAKIIGGLIYIAIAFAFALVNISYA